MSQFSYERASPFVGIEELAKGFHLLYTLEDYGVEKVIPNYG